MVQTDTIDAFGVGALRPSTRGHEKRAPQTAPVLIGPPRMFIRIL
jgi:hypothetical protein